MSRRRSEYIGHRLKPEFGWLTRAMISRLCSLEYRNRKRASKLQEAIVEVVDFIAVCIEQEWACCICGEEMDPGLVGPSSRAISVEHDPALSACREHTKRTVRAAHISCNVSKGHKVDIPRAAKTKRVTASEETHVQRLAMKAAGEELPAGAIRSRGFEKGVKRQWPKRSLR